MENKEIKIIPKNIYLIKEVNYKSHKQIYEWECVSVSETSYKFSDKLNKRVFWIEKNYFSSSEFGERGYHVFECIHDHEEEQMRILQLLAKKSN